MASSGLRPTLSRERQRLEALRRYEVLDTPPEESLDRITKLAAKLFDMPISLVSLVDESRQWFKSRFGLEAQWTRREISFCTHAIECRDPMVVEDATLDPRFASNPLVTGEPGIRFYAGASIRTQEGHALGTLCVIDRRPHADFDAEKRAVLQDLANLVMERLESREAVRALRREVTEHVGTEERLRAALRDKEVLMREIHHRVKNNMQSVVAMLQVEAMRLRHLPEALERMDAMSRRIVLLGRIHQQLYVSGEFHRMDIGRHLGDLASDLMKVEQDRRTEIVVRTDPLMCDLDAALPVGLIANELLLNSLKHGIAGTVGGKIQMDLLRRGDRVELSVSDQGAGGRADGGTGIGTVLVQALAGQIDATVTIARERGWRTVVSIPGTHFSPAAEPS